MNAVHFCNPERQVLVFPQFTEESSELFPSSELAKLGFPPGKSSSWSVHLTTSLAYELLLRCQWSVLCSRRHAEEVTGEGCQRSGRGWEFKGRRLGAVAESCCLPRSVGRRKRFLAPWRTSPHSLTLQSQAARSGHPAWQGATQIQQRLPAKGDGREPGSIRTGTGKGQETEIQKEAFKETAGWLPREDTV